jgi:hypothetical protein
MLGSFPGRDLIRAWLKAGVFEKGKGFAPTVSAITKFPRLEGLAIT